MKRILSTVLVLAMLLGMGSFVYAEPTEQITISGLVSDPEGNPITDAVVLVNSINADMDSEGRYTVTVDVAAEYVIEASKQGYAQFTYTLPHVDSGPVDCDITLTPFIQISGVITDLNDLPVGEAAVSINGSEETQSGPDGSYSLEVPAADEFEITATKDGYAVYNATVERTDYNPVIHNIVLNNLIVFAGIVVDAAFRPISNIAATVNGYEALTDENGAYSIDAGVDPDHDYELALVQNGFTYYTETLHLETADPVTKDITLENYYTVTGRLLDNGDPAVLMPLAGEPDRTFAVHITSPDLNVTAAPDGTFSFIGSRAFDIDVARQGQYMAATAYVADCSLQTLPVDISLDWAKVAVSAKDESGAPITRFEVVISSPPLTPVSKFYISDAGEAVVDGFEAAATEHTVTVKADGYASVSQTVDFSGVASGEAVAFAAVLKKGTINLLVKNVNETKVTGMDVKIDDPDAVVTSNGQGSYTITGIGVSDTGQRKILISGSDVYSSQIITTRVVSEEPLSLTAYLCLMSTSQTGTITGKIVASDGTTGVEGAVVRLAGKFTVTSRTGNYTLSDIPMGIEYALSVEKKGYVTNSQADTVLFEAGDETEQTLSPIRLHRSNTITGYVTDSMTGEPVSGATITLSVPCKVFAGADGSYIVEGVPSEGLSMSFGAPGYETAVSSIDAAGAEGQSLTKDISLAALTNAGVYQISGTVISTRGLKIAGAAVTEPASGITAYTDGLGRFAVSGIEDMPAQVSVSAEGYAEKTFQLQYDNGKFSLDQSFVLSKSTDNASISGVVTESVENDALMDALVYAYVKDESNRRVVVLSTTTDASGAFSLTGLEAGKRYNICATKSGYAQCDIVVNAGTTGLALILSPGGSILFTVKNAGGVPLEGVQCYAPAVDSVYTTDASGQVLIDGLAFATTYEFTIKGNVDLYRTTGYTATIYDSSPNITANLTLAAQTSSVSLSGRVLDDSTKAPIADAAVTVSGYKTFTDAQGYYKLYGFTRGATVSATVVKSGYTSTTTNVMINPGSDATVLDLSMEANTVTVYGKVVNDSGAAMKNVVVKLGGITTKTDAFGYYSFKTSLSTSSVLITATMPGYQEGSVYTYFSKSFTASEVNFILSKTYTITANLMVKGTQRAITSGTVYLLESGDSISNRKSASVDYEGKAEFEDIVTGTYEVWATASGYDTSAHETVKVIDGDRTINIYLEADDDGGSGGTGGTGSTYSPSSPKPTSTAAPEPSAEPETGDWTGFQDMGDASLAWAVEPVNGLVEKGVIVRADNFRPNDKITREEFIKMLVTALGLYDENAQCSFKDAGKGDWYYSYAASAYNAGIIQGYPDGTFGAGKDIIRQDMCIMSYRAANSAGIALTTVNEAEKFTDDASIAPYAREAVTAMQQAGIINGMGDGTFAPVSNATRAQTAKIMWELLQTKQGQ